MNLHMAHTTVRSVVGLRKSPSRGQPASSCLCSLHVGVKTYSARAAAMTTVYGSASLLLAIISKILVLVDTCNIISTSFPFSAEVSIQHQ